MNCFVVLFCFISSVLVNSVQSDPDAHVGGFPLATGPPSLGDSSVHYAYNRQYDYGYHHPEPLLPLVLYDYGHAQHNLVDHYGVIHPIHGYHSGHEVICRFSHMWANVLILPLGNVMICQTNVYRQYC